ncbi:hypothetical protein ANN_06300 [Periplaneta americana]|uniref:Uncharacterized protein n=1 Tax=Periplaneta americana TaxID=6978 RepID=A0ABQ8TD69_PERAM|nr:hypothetical protein ANN_06300 [Periplaneta americana]
MPMMMMMMMESSASYHSPMIPTLEDMDGERSRKRQQQEFLSHLHHCVMMSGLYSALSSANFGHLHLKTVRDLFNPPPWRVSKTLDSFVLDSKSFSCDTSIPVFQILKETNDADYEELRHLSYHGIGKEVETAVKRWFRSQAADFYDTRIQKLIPCADKNSIKHTTMRVLLFQTITSGIPLPPQPVLTRWGTWLDAVNYYAEHYGKIMEVIDALDSTGSSAVAAVKSLPSEQLLEDILFIDSNFKIVSKRITLLESSKLQISKALNKADKASQIVIQNITNFRKNKRKAEDRKDLKYWVSSENLPLDRKLRKKDKKEENLEKRSKMQSRNDRIILSKGEKQDDGDYGDLPPTLQESHKQGSSCGPKEKSLEELNLATVVAKELDDLDLSTFPRMFGGDVRGWQVKSARVRHHVGTTFADVPVANLHITLPVPLPGRSSTWDQAIRGTTLVVHTGKSSLSLVKWEM